MRAIAADASREPSSTTMASKARRFDAASALKAGRDGAGAVATGMITLRSGGLAESGPAVRREGSLVPYVYASLCLISRLGMPQHS